MKDHSVTLSSAPHASDDDDDDDDEQIDSGAEDEIDRGDGPADSDDGSQEPEDAAESETDDDDDDDDDGPPEPPSAEELGVDVAGLPPQRGRLVRFAAWLDRQKSELATCQENRAKYLDAMGVPSLTEARLRAIIEADTSNYLKWISSGVPALTEVQIQKFERQQLEARLVDDKHKRDVAVAALDQVEKDIKRRRAEIRSLEERHRGFVFDAVHEHAETVGVRYVREMHAIGKTIAELMGLAKAFRDLGGRDGFSRWDYDKAVHFPRFPLKAIPETMIRRHADMRLPDGSVSFVSAPTISVWQDDAKVAAKPWRDLIAAWTADPRAEIGRKTEKDEEA